MFLAFDPASIVTVPFGWLLGQLYQWTQDYGLAMILFAILVKVILIPITAKSKKSMMKMSRLQPRIQEIQRKYANDQQKQNEAIQQLQKEEGATMGCGGCLWSFVPLLILFPLFGVIRSPIQYMLMESAESAAAIVKVVKDTVPELFSNAYYEQLMSAALIQNESVQAALKEALPSLSAQTMAGIDFSFLDMNLASNPTIPIFGAGWAWDWAHIGGALIPVLSAGSQVLSMFVSQKLNNSVITNEKGLEDKETAEKSQSAQTSKMMMWVTPIMSLVIGFSYPSALSLYWFIQGIASIIIDVILTKKYRKLYDAEDAARLEKAMAEEAAEAEKERIRAEKRAANPEGITANTSKKKLQQRKNEEAEAARAEAAKEYAAKKGIVQEEEEKPLPLSGDAQRPYCKGRAYDPHRYNSTEEEN